MDSKVSAIGSAINMLFKIVPYLLFPLINGVIIGMKATEIKLNMCFRYFSVVHTIGCIAFCAFYWLHVRDYKEKEKIQKMNE